jgi:hypothetical protein
MPIGESRRHSYGYSDFPSRESNSSLCLWVAALPGEQGVFPELGSLYEPVYYLGQIDHPDTRRLNVVRGHLSDSPMLIKWESVQSNTRQHAVK